MEVDVKVSTSVIVIKENTSHYDYSDSHRNISTQVVDTKIWMAKPLPLLPTIKSRLNFCADLPVLATRATKTSQELH